MFAVDESMEAYRPRPAPLFRPSRIVLAKGSNRTEPVGDWLRRICAAYPDAEVIEAFGTPHNRVDLGETDPLRLHERGKQTLVLGEHRSAVRFSDEGGNACPNYWHFSPYGFCPYGCHYCYLAGTPGVWFSPTVKIFLNLEEILAEVDRTATRLGRPTAFYLGKLQDGLALEPLSGYARTMIPFFARHPYARMVVLTKSADVENLLDLDHAGRTILSWTVNAPEVAQQFREKHARCHRPDRGHAAMRPGRLPGASGAHADHPCGRLAGTYGRFMATLLESVSLSRITLGSICSYPQAQRLMELKLGKQNAISALLDRGQPSRTTVGFVHRSTREEVYRYLIECIRRQRPDLEIGLCLEDEAMFASLGLAGEHRTLQLVL